MKILALFTALFFYTTLFAQPYERTKSLMKSFVVTKDCSVQISNKYGDVQIVPWDKDSVKFEINVKVVNKKEDDAIKKINNIDFSFTSTPYYVIAKTVFLDSKTGILNDIGDMAGSIISSGNYVNITYVVSIPSVNALTIDNKYGNVYTTDHSNSFQLTLSNGDFKANNLTGSSKINISFGNASVNEIVKGSIEASYVEFEIKKAEKLSIIGRSSKFNIVNAESLELDSKRDKFYVDTLSYLSGKTDFTYINAGILKSQINLNISFGDLLVQELSSDFKSMNLVSSYTDITLSIPSGFSSTADITYKKMEMTYPPSMTGLQKEIVNESSDTFKLKGTIGSDTTSTNSILVNANSGSLTIISK
ncbi:MAG: hypothetical protein V1904_11750 [Bacteroidota bacterium]